MPGHPAIFALLILAAASLYGYTGLKRAFAIPPLLNYKTWAIRIFLMIDVVFILFSVLWLTYIRTINIPEYTAYRLHFYLAGVYMLVFGPKLFFAVFVLMHDLKNLLAGLLVMVQKHFGKNSNLFSRIHNTRWVLIAGMFVAILAFFWMTYGLTVGRHRFQVERIEISFPELPSAFDGFKVVHFSDTHLGSFAQKHPVSGGLQMIKDLNPDIVFFTGDLINNHPAEAAPFIEYFSVIQPPYGKYAVLGNHDLGDYRTWSKIDDIDPEEYKIERLHKQMGFHLLRNEHVFISRGNDSIMVAGVDNWGLDPFMKLGDLDKALGEHQCFPFQIIMTHDPSHWREEILPETNIQLTLSGHTHGMQLGIHTRFFSWSPSVWIYPEWNGLFREDDQKIYVNRGFGYLTLPGRIGMPPEITKITLRQGAGGSKE